MTAVHFSEADVSRRAAAAFAPSRVVRIGAEVEWLVFDRSDPTRAIGASTTAAVAAGALPAGGRITVEPGGQVELVTEPHPGPRQLVDAIDTDTAVLAERFAQHGLVLVPLGLDPIRPARRTLDLPRYRAMQRYFETVSPAGLQMMCLTASLQLNVDFGSDPETTWRHAHSCAPVLSSIFANSPTADGSNPQRASRRQRIWASTDPSRTRPVGSSTDDWGPYILDARVMLHEPANGIDVALPARSFRTWLRSVAPPTPGELELHLTTLFPPLRPRGYLELRMIDAVPGPGRAAAIALVWSLLTDQTAGARASEVCRSIVDPWRVALDEGVANADVRAAAVAVLGTTADCFRRSDRGLSRACEEWRDQMFDGEAGVDDAGLIALAEPIRPHRCTSEMCVIGWQKTVRARRRRDRVRRVLRHDGHRSPEAGPGGPHAAQPLRPGRVCVVASRSTAPCVTQTARRTTCDSSPRAQPFRASP